MSPSPFDPQAVLDQAVGTAEQRGSSAGFFILALLVGVGFLVYKAGKK